MNITPANYSNYNQSTTGYGFEKKSNPAFGSIHFTPAARSVITEHLHTADFITRNDFIRKLDRIIKDAANTRDILVDAPSYISGLIAKVGAGVPKKGRDYGLKTFIQEDAYNTKFLEDALAESKISLKADI